MLDEHLPKRLKFVPSERKVVKESVRKFHVSVMQDSRRSGDELQHFPKEVLDVPLTGAHLNGKRNWHILDRCPRNHLRRPILDKIFAIFDGC